MPISRGKVRLGLLLILLITILIFISYPYLLSSTPLTALFYSMEIAVVVVLFAGMFFLLFLLLALGSR